MSSLCMNGCTELPVLCEMVASYPSFSSPAPCEYGCGYRSRLQASGVTLL